MATATVKYDEATDDYYLEFPEDFFDQMGWQVGDTLKWTPNEDGSWILTKKEAEASGTGDQERHVPPDGTST